MKSRIAIKLFLYFSAALFLFALINGIVFTALFRASMIKKNKEDMEARSLSIATALSNYISSGSTGSNIVTGKTEISGSGKSYGKGSGGKGSSSGTTTDATGSGGNYGNKGGGLSAYLRFVNDIAMSDVWIVDENLNLIMNRQIVGKEYNYADLPADADKVVAEVFNGKSTFSEDFSSLMDTPTLTASAPVVVGGQIIAAVLLHSPVNGLEGATSQGIRISAISIATALIISAILSVFLAMIFTKPLNIMKNTALKLADGDYTVKTGIKQKDEAGDLAGIIDILSERLQFAKKESENLDKLRQNFISNITHELKTPVTVIRGSLEALCDGVVTEPSQVEEYYRQMLSESVSLQRLVSDLLELSRLQNTEFRIEVEKLNLCDILSDAVRSAVRLGHEKGIEIIQEYDTKIFEVNGDYLRLRQMFLIILDNAVKFSQDGGVINVSLKRGLVAISDKGCGISEKDLPYIFDRFYKTKSEENKTGSGLGLAIAKQIAERHKIKISVVSKLEEGTTFLIRFN